MRGNAIAVGAREVRSGRVGLYGRPLVPPHGRRPNTEGSLDSLKRVRIYEPPSEGETEGTQCWHHLPPALANDMMCELGEHTERHDAETDEKHDECNADGLPVAPADLGWIRDVGDGRYVVQMA